MRRYAYSLLIFAVLASGLFSASTAYASFCFIPNGCTGTSTTPGYGQVLVGGKNGEYEFAATSSLFSTSSANGYINSIDKGFFFSTTSADAWKNVRSFFSTTSDDYYKSQNNFFSSTSVNYWKSVTDLFSTTSATFFLSVNTLWATTSADYWQTQRSLFSTSSATFFLSVQTLFSTTSADYYATQRNFFSTTSADYFLTQRNAFSTTSAVYFVDASTTIPKTYKANTYTTAALQTIPYASTTALTMVTGSTTNLIVSSAGGTGTRCAQFAADGTLSANASGCASAISGGTAGMLTSWANSTTLNATGTPTVAAIQATSTTATSTFAGPFRIIPVANTAQPVLMVGTSTNPVYGPIAGDLIDTELDWNGTTGINAINGGVGSCASSGLWADGNIPALNSNFVILAFLNTGWTGSGCAFGNGKEAALDGVLGLPTGNWNFEAGNGAFKFWTGTNQSETITPTGNFGISTTSPGTALGVQGNQFIAGNITSTSSVANIFPYASTTAITSSVASTSLLFVNGLGGCIPGQYLTWSAGSFGCATDQAGASASGVATTSFAATSPIQVTPSASAITYSILAASASQAGSMAPGDFQRLYTATTTFSAPLVYTLGTNAVTCPTCITSAVTSLAASGNASVSGSTGAVTITVPWAFTDTTVFGPHTISTTTAFVDFPGLVAATSTIGTLMATSSFTNLAVKSAIVVDNAAGLEGAYGGSGTCAASNFITALDASGAKTCGTASISGVNLGSNLNAHTVSGSITGTSYNGSAAVSDWALNMANANSWTATQTFKTSTTTNLGASGFFNIPTTLVLPTTLTQSQLVVNTTAASTSLQFGAAAVYATTSVSFTWATTSPSTVATDTIMIMNGPRGVKFDNIACRTTSPVFATTTVAIGTGVATSTYVLASSTATFTTLSTNNSFNSLQTIYIAIGGYSYLGVSQISCGLGEEYTY